MNMYYNTKKNLCNYPVNSIQAWVSFISRSFSSSEKSFSGISVSPLFKNQHLIPNSNSIWIARAHLNEFLRTLMCYTHYLNDKLLTPILRGRPLFISAPFYGYLKLLQSYMEKPRTNCLYRFLLLL